MYSLLTEYERGLIECLISKAFNNASNSFSSIVREPVSIMDLKVGVSENYKEIFSNDDSQECYVLITNLVGELIGKSYLIFTQEDLRIIYDNCFNQSDFFKGSNELLEGFLLEIDNIVSASFITILSNELNINFYGGVPSLEYSDIKSLDRVIAREMLVNGTVFQFKANMQLEKSKVTPRFIWMIDENFIEKLRDYKHKDTTTQEVIS